MDYIIVLIIVAYSFIRLWSILRNPNCGSCGKEKAKGCCTPEPKEQTIKFYKK
jgi:hypothetical protein